MADQFQTDAYIRSLFAIQTGLESSIPVQMARLTTWVNAARAAGVQEANVIAVLRSWNTWQATNADLANIVIPLEIKRVQQGGDIGGGDISRYQGTQPPALPEIAGVITSQGGARLGESQYTGPISPIASPVVEIPVALQPPPTTHSVSGIDVPSTVPPVSPLTLQTEVLGIATTGRVQSKVSVNELVRAPGTMTGMSEAGAGTGGAPGWVILLVIAAAVVWLSGWAD